MRASRLIEELQDLIDQNGDQEVYVDTRYHTDRCAQATVVQYESVSPSEEEDDDGEPVFNIIAD